jgi:hypothetical protein
MINDDSFYQLSRQVYHLRSHVDAGSTDQSVVASIVFEDNSIRG